MICVKLDANNYTTSMTGLKYKLAHKRAEKDKWSTTDNAQSAINTDITGINCSVEK